IPADVFSDHVGCRLARLLFLPEPGYVLRHHFARAIGATGGEALRSLIPVPPPLLRLLQQPLGSGGQCRTSRIRLCFLACSYCFTPMKFSTAFRLLPAFSLFAPFA